jgi:hypothetical protein
MGLIEKPAMITAAGSPPKEIAEYVGRLNTGNVAVSVARMVSPGGWHEPGQTPEFDEYSLVLRGLLQIETRAGVTKVRTGQAFLASRGEWVRYTTPYESGQSISRFVCQPSHQTRSIETLHVNSLTNPLLE